MGKQLKKNKTKLIIKPTIKLDSKDMNKFENKEMIKIEKFKFSWKYSNFMPSFGKIE